VRLFALEAHVVGQFEHGPQTQVVVESVAWVHKPLVCVDVFELGTLQGTLLNVRLQLQQTGRVTAHLLVVLLLFLFSFLRVAQNRRDSWRDVYWFVAFSHGVFSLSYFL